MATHPKARLAVLARDFFLLVRPNWTPAGCRFHPRRVRRHGPAPREYVAVHRIPWWGEDHGAMPRRLSQQRRETESTYGVPHHADQSYVIAPVAARTQPHTSVPHVPSRGTFTRACVASSRSRRGRAPRGRPAGAGSHASARLRITRGPAGRPARHPAFFIQALTRTRTRATYVTPASL